MMTLDILKIKRAKIYIVNKIYFTITQSENKKYHYLNLRLSPLQTLQ